MVMTIDLPRTHPFPYLRDALDSWDSLEQATKDKLLPHFGGQQFLNMIENQRSFLGLIEAYENN